MKTKWAYWVCQLAGWGGVVGLGQTMDWLQRITSPTGALGQDHLFLPLSCLAGLLATHLLRIIILRGQWLEMAQSKIVFRYGMALVVTALLLSLFGTFFFTTAPMKETRLETFTAAMLINSSLIGAWMAIYFLLHFYEGFHSAREERALLKEAYTASQLEALQLQLNPHFLFNALNTIRALIPASSLQAREAVTKLAETLRVTLSSGEEMTISLRREIDVVRDYLSMEMLRFGDHLQVIENIDADAFDAEIPPLLLLTIVENAIKHGVQCHEEGGALTISARRDSEEIIVTVGSPDPDGESRPSDSLGIGLRNVRERLRLIYGEKTSATLSSDQNGTMECTLRFPAVLNSEMRQRMIHGE